MFTLLLKNKNIPLKLILTFNQFRNLSFYNILIQLLAILRDRTNRKLLQPPIFANIYLYIRFNIGGWTQDPPGHEGGSWSNRSYWRSHPKLPLLAYMLLLWISIVRRIRSETIPYIIFPRPLTSLMLWMMTGNKYATR